MRHEKALTIAATNGVNVFAFPHDTGFFVGVAREVASVHIKYRGKSG